MSAFNSGSDEPQFMLKKMAPYNIPRVTSRKNVEYFVNKDMENKIVSNLGN